MTNTLLDRAGAICGVVFTIGLFLAAGDGSHAYDPARAAAGMWSIALAVPGYTVPAARNLGQRSSKGTCSVDS